MLQKKKKKSNNFSLSFRRIIEWFGSPCPGQGHLQVDEVAQSPVQPDLECF